MFTRLLTTIYAMSSCLAHNFTVCDSGINFAGIKTISLSPDPPVTGEDLKVTLAGTSQIFLGEPTAHLEFSIMGVPLSTLDVDLCKNNACPILKNTPYELVMSYPIPDEHPGNLNIDVAVTIKDVVNTVGCYELVTPVINKNLWSIHHSSYLFHKWIFHYNKSYDSLDEYLDRLAIFDHNTNYILSHTHKSFSLAHNELSDKTPDEYQKLLGYKYVPKTNYNYVTSIPYNTLSNVTSGVDWRTKGAVTPVKNQGSCGSCWSFSTTGALEGAHFIKTGNLVEFSEEELVSCDKTDNGCNGGLMDNAFKWISDNGLCSEQDYPYTSGTGTVDECKTSCVPVDTSNVINYVDVKQTVGDLEAAVSRQPVSIAIEADKLSFQLYSKGVYHSDCGTNLDHGVLLVGYGLQDDLDYWIVKNSWGDTWGDGGYIKLLKNSLVKGGECGILLSASYPEV
jgi:hypothetical protein